MMCAGASVLMEKRLISEELYNTFLDSDKQTRNVLLGNLQRENPDLVEILNAGYKEYVDRFISANKIDEKDIIDRARDGVTVNATRSKIKRTQFGDYIVFRPKNEYYIMVEFPTVENGKQNIRVFKTVDDIIIKGGKINEENIAYKYLLEALTSKLNKNTKRFYTAYNMLCTLLEKMDEERVNKNETEDKYRIISSVKNDRLREVLLEIII